jgi:hypothetical protein
VVHHLRAQRAGFSPGVEGGLSQGAQGDRGGCSGSQCPEKRSAV